MQPINDSRNNRFGRCQVYFFWSINLSLYKAFLRSVDTCKLYVFSIRNTEARTKRKRIKNKEQWSHIKTERKTYRISSYRENDKSKECQK